MSKNIQTYRLFRRKLSLIMPVTLVAAIAPALVLFADSASASPGMSSGDDTAAAIELADRRGSKVHIVSRDTETATTYANPDGTLTTETATTPVRVAGSSGWTAVDYDLHRDKGGWSPRAAPVPVTFSDGGDSDAAIIGSGSRQLTMNWDTTLPQPAIDGPTATYALGDGQKLVLTATATGYEQSLVLDHAPKSLPQLRLPFDAQSLSLDDDRSNGFVFKDITGAVVYTVPTPIMYGADVDPESGAPTQTHTVATDFTNTSAGPRLDMSPSLTWLNSEAVTYPVTIDPSVDVGHQGDTFVQDNQTASQIGAPYLWAGYYKDHANRAYLDFQNISTFYGQKITSATLKLYNYNANSCTAAKIYAYPLNALFSKDTVWSNKPSANTSSAYASSASFANGVDGKCANAWANIDVAKIVSGWANRSINYAGLQLSGVEKAGNQGWAFCAFNDATDTSACADPSHGPSLIVTYDYQPPAPVGLCVTPSPDGCVSPSYVTSATPVLTAKAPDSQVLNYKFEIYNEDSTSTSPVQTVLVNNVPANAAAQAKVSTALADPGMYQFRAQACNASFCSAWSGYYEFAIRGPRRVTVPQQYFLGTSSAGRPLAPNETVVVPVATQLGASVDEATAVGATVSLQTQGSGGKVVFATDTGVPSAGTPITFTGPNTSTNLDVPLTADGSVAVTNYSTSTISIQVLVQSWYAAIRQDGPENTNAPQLADPASDASNLDDGTTLDPSDSDDAMATSDSSLTPNSDLPTSDDDQSISMDPSSYVMCDDDSTCTTNPDAPMPAVGNQRNAVTAASEPEVTEETQANTACATPTDGTSSDSVDVTCASTDVPSDQQLAVDAAQADADIAQDPTLQSTDEAFSGEAQDPTGASTPAPSGSQSRALASANTVRLINGYPSSRHRKTCPSNHHFFGRHTACTARLGKVVFYTKTRSKSGTVKTITGTLDVKVDQYDQQYLNRHDLTTWTYLFGNATGIIKTSGICLDVTPRISHSKTNWDNYSGDYSERCFSPSELDFKTYHAYWNHYESIAANRFKYYRTAIQNSYIPRNNDGYKFVNVVHTGESKRIDNMSYLSGAGSIFPRVNGTFKLDASERGGRYNDYLFLEAAQFMRDVQDRAPTHPGRPGTRVPLQRTLNTAVRDANRNKACPRGRGNKVYSCDEYPFATTFQGAAYAPSDRDWGWRLVKAQHNSNVGTRLNSRFFRNWRVMDLDHYYVSIYNFPSGCGRLCR